MSIASYTLCPPRRTPYVRRAVHPVAPLLCRAGGLGAQQRSLRFADAVANFVVAVVAALTLGQLGMSTPESPTFINQLHQVWCPCPAAPPAARCQGGQRCAAGV